MSNIQPRKQRIFLDYEKISSHLKCSICQDVFQDPMRTACGHTFCYLCIQSWAQVKKNCPMCKKSIKKRALERDLIAYNMIDDLPTSCAHGCQWQGPYNFIKKHQRECLFRPFKDLSNIDQNAPLIPEKEIVDLDD